MIARAGIEPATPDLQSRRSQLLSVDRQIHLAQKSLEARVIGHALEQLLAEDFGKACIFLHVGPLEPLKRKFIFAAIRVGLGHKKRPVSAQCAICACSASSASA